jgi:hypothetical protein
LLEDDKVFYEFWFSKEVPLTAPPEPDAFCLTAVKEGTLLGALKVHDERYDFKDEEIPPGVYTMRLGLQPEDGDHLGTSPTRTFALLVPAKDDRAVDSLADHDELSEASSVVNAAEHPSNLNLQPVKNDGKEFPKLASLPGDEWEVVCIRLRGKLKDKDKTVPLTFALVFEGVGEY